MNIFLLDEDPKTCVRYMNDSHVSKMILESAQILSTIIHTTNTRVAADKVYKPTHPNHPCVRWCGDSLSNWKYLRNLSLLMDDEFNYRWGRRHRSAQIIRDLPEPVLKDIGLTVPARALPLELRKKLGPAETWSDVVFSYRVFYNLHKRHLAKWTRRPFPPWWETSGTRIHLLRQSLTPRAFHNFQLENQP